MIFLLTLKGWDVGDKESDYLLKRVHVPSYNALRMFIDKEGLLPFLNCMPEAWEGTSEGLPRDFDTVIDQNGIGGAWLPGQSVGGWKQEARETPPV